MTFPRCCWSLCKLTQIDSEADQSAKTGRLRQVPCTRVNYYCNRQYKGIEEGSYIPWLACIFIFTSQEGIPVTLPACLNCPIFEASWALPNDFPLELATPMALVLFGLIFQQNGKLAWLCCISSMASPQKLPCPMVWEASCMIFCVRIRPC